MSLKLTTLPIKEEQIKISGKLRKSDHDRLTLYTDYVSAERGVDYSEEEVVESILSMWLSTDKKFKSWLKAHESNSTQNIDSEESSSVF